MSNENPKPTIDVWLNEVEDQQRESNAGPRPAPSAGPKIITPAKTTNKPRVYDGAIPVNPKDTLDLEISKNKLEAAYVKYSSSKTTANKNALTKLYNSYNKIAVDYVKTYKVELSSDQLPLGVASPSIVKNAPASYQTAGQYAQLQGQEIIKPLSITKGKKKVTVNIHQDANGKFLRATDINTGKEIPIQTDKDGNLSIGGTLSKPETAGAGNSGNGAGGGGAGYGGSGAVAPVAPVRKTKTELAADYNVQMAVINSDKSLVKLFNDAVAQQMTPAAFAAALRNTDFYLKHGAAWAEAQIKKLGDPGDWKDQLAQAKTLIEQTAVDLGMKLEPNEIDALANSSLHSSRGDVKQITSTWLNTHIAKYGEITGKGGTTAETINSLKSYGADYGVQHSDDWYINAAKSIVQKTGTQTDFETEIKDLAKTKYAPFADQIDKGITVQQIASPYINSMSNILEVPSASIGLNDRTINQALTSLDSKGQPMAQPLWQFETSLRQDPRWATTKNANDTLSSLSNSILKTFGLVS